MMTLDELQTRLGEMGATLHIYTGESSLNDGKWFVTIRDESNETISSGRGTTLDEAFGIAFGEPLLPGWVG